MCEQLHDSDAGADPAIRKHLVLRVLQYLRGALVGV